MAYYSHPSGLPSNQTRGIASQVRSELDLIAASFATQPTAAQLYGGNATYAADSGAADAYVVTVGAAVVAYADGMTLLFKATNANTGASTINVNALGLKAIVRADGSVLQAGDILAGQIIQISYSTTAGKFQLSASGTAISATNAAASAAAASASAAAAAASAASAAASANLVLLQVACSDELTPLTAGTAKVTFRSPYAFTLTGVSGSVNTAPTGATLLTVDVNESGATVLSTKLTFDASEKTTVTATTPAVISDNSIALDAEISIDIDAVGSTIAGAGLKITLTGTKT